MTHYQAEGFADAYHAILKDLINSPEYITRPRDMLINENCDVSIVLEDPLSCLYYNKTRSSQYKYIAAEFMWYFMGRRDVEWISKYAAFWKSIQNPDGTVNSSYGHLLFANPNEHGTTQYEWALSSLIKDKDSRQAVIHFNLPVHQHSENKDFVCTMYGIFQIRNNKLNFTIHMRSNDAILGLPTDIAFFATLQSQMLNHLREIYPELEMGTYTHFANSLHIYERHFDIVKRILESDFVSENIPSVQTNLINTDASQSPEFLELSNDSYFGEDQLFNWIALNIKN
jgi:thymidylate synthase